MIASKLELLAEAFGLAFAASGATVAVVLGKLIIGMVLAALALGFLLRLKGRRARHQGSKCVYLNCVPMA